MHELRQAPRKTTFSEEIIMAPFTIDRIVWTYEVIKEIVMENHSKEIEWCKNIRLSDITPWRFYQEYSWVVINSGMKNRVAEGIHSRFWHGFQGEWEYSDPDFNAVRHQSKNRALQTVYQDLATVFNQLKSAPDRLEYLETLPHIGPVTKYHLARNLGIDCAKPDRHLVRIAAFFGYDDVQKFCQEIADKTGDRIGVVDLIWWRYAESTPDYLEAIEYAYNKKRDVI